MADNVLGTLFQGIANAIKGVEGNLEQKISPMEFPERISKFSTGGGGGSGGGDEMCWRVEQSIPNALTAAPYGCFVFQGYLHCIVKTAASKTEIWRRKDGEWAYFAPCKSDHGSSGIYLEVNGELFTTSTSYKDFFKYDPDSNSWIALENLAKYSTFSTSFVYNNEIYYTSYNGDMQYAYKWDGTTWVSLPYFLAVEEEQVRAWQVVGDTLYYYGNDQKKLYRYDFITGETTVICSLPRTSADWLFFNGAFYDFPSNPNNTIYKYTLTGEITEFPIKTIVKNTYGAYAFFDNKIYSFGNGSHSTGYPVVISWTPPSE